MNESMPLADDEMVRAMKRARRGPLYGILATVAVAGLLVGGYVLRGKHATADELAQRGYTETTVKMTGLFSFSFSGMKVGARCSGTFERIPFSTSLNEACFSVAAPPPPPLSPRESVERSLAKKYAAEGFAAFTCPEIAAGGKSVDCTISAVNGTSVPVHVEAKGTAEDPWQSWSYAPTEIYFRGEDVATKLPTALAPELKKRGLAGELTVDCGAGLRVTQANAVTCKAELARGQRRKREGSLTLTFADDGSISKWSLTGI